MHRLSNMPEDSIHAEIFRDNIADAQEHPSYGNWAGGIVKQYSRLGMVSPFSSSGIAGLNSLGFQANMEGQLCRVWDGLHVSPRTAFRHWGMNGILFLTAPILPTFVASFGRCIKMLMVPCSVLCGTRTRKLSAIA